MGVSFNPSVPMDGLELYLDAANPRSYSGTGTDWNDLTKNRSVYGGPSSGHTYPSFTSSGLQSSFNFVNDGTTVNTIESTTQNIITNTQTKYSRVVVARVSQVSSEWSTLICNVIGNNVDMALIINSAGNRLAFHQYTGTNDYTVSTGNISIPPGWVVFGMTVDLDTNNLFLYQNGYRVLQNNSLSTSIGNSNSNTIVIGGAQTDSYTGGRMFKGDIAAVMHYNRILTNAEMETIYNAYRGRYDLSDQPSDTSS
jgi:hypothetical protein